MFEGLDDVLIIVSGKLGKRNKNFDLPVESVNIVILNVVANVVLGGFYESTQRCGQCTDIRCNVYVLSCSFYSGFASFNFLMYNDVAECYLPADVK